MITQTQNPALYRELAKPFESTQAAKDAIGKFYEDLELIRKKHKIRDLIAVVEVDALNGEGDEGVMTCSVGFGDPLKKPVMLALALGKEQNQIQEAMMKLRR